MNGFYLAMIVAAILLAVLFWGIAHLFDELAYEGAFVASLSVAGLFTLAIPVITVIGFIEWGSSL